MESNTLFVKLKELGQVHSKREELQEYCKENLAQIIKHLPRRILNSDGGCIVDCVFNGLSEDESLRKYKIKVIDIILQVMRKESVSLTHCADVISRLCLELPRSPVDDLVKWCNDSIQSIVDDSDANMIWRDVVPECMSTLSSHLTIKHFDTEMTVEDYKVQCVHTLCQCQWKEHQFVQLAALFTDLKLPRNEHTQVVNKLCSYIIDISPDGLPPLILQLMRLCKLYNMDIVLSHLSHYFSVHLYSKLEPPPQDSESTTMDMDDVVLHSPAELSRSLSTCIYHITQGPAEPELIRKHIKIWPKSQLLRAPFVMDLALAMSDKGSDFRSVCLDVIKSAIEQREMDNIRCKESALVRSVTPPDVDVASVLKVLTTESANHRQLTVMGLINLAFSLLSVARVKPTALSCWSHGKLILVRLSKSQPETASHILGQLGDKLAGHSAQKQYADCLYVLCKLTPVSVEGRTELSAILENCQPSVNEYRVSAAVLDAVHPLINFSTRTRDTLVMVCRKGLYSRDSLHRCLALSGFLSVLAHMRLPRGALSGSQSVCSDQYSAHSYLTQIAVDVHNTQHGAPVTSRVRNEAVCMEVVSILRRCLMQDALVKELLYTRLYECSKEKVALHESILELLYDHLTKYLSDANSTELLMDKCVQICAVNATLVEPIAYLLYVIVQFLQPEEELEIEDILESDSVETGSAYLKNKLNSILTRMCCNEELGKIDLDDPGLSDITPESKAKCMKLQQTIQMYEALIAYQIVRWQPNSIDVASKVYKLFKDCDQLLEKAKTPAKVAKKRRKSLNETKDTTKSQKSQKSQKEKQGGAEKLSNMVKDRAGPFKPLPCLWDLKFCVRIAELLYEEQVAWSSLEQRNQLRGRRDFHQWALRGLLSVLGTEHLDKKLVASHVVRLSSIMYRRCVCRFQEMCDFDDQTALSCLEVFRSCLILLFSTNYTLKLEFFLPTIVDQTETTPPACIAIVLEQLLNCLNRIESETTLEGSDLMSRKLVGSLIGVASLLLEQRVQNSTEMSSVIAKFEEYMRESEQDLLPLIPSLLSAGFREQQDAPFLDDLLVKLTKELGKIDEEDTSTGQDTASFPKIDSRSGHVVLNYVCAHIMDRFRCTEHLMHRAKDLTAALSTATRTSKQRIDRDLNELYKSLVIQLCQLSTWTRSLCKLRCSIGTGSQRVVSLPVRLYALLAALARQMDPPLAQHARFERLLKISGKRLSGVIDNLITYLEASQQNLTATKVLRDTKLIPRLVLEAEQFSKYVILLADKAKLNWQQYLSLGTARDFKIKGPVLQEILNAQGAADADETRDDINDAVTEVLHPLSQTEEEDHSDVEVDTSKKRKET